MNAMKTMTIYPDAELLSQAAAVFFAERARLALADHGRFSVLLAGGSTPRRTYELLAQKPLAEQIPWHACHFFWGDERCLPDGDERRNETMVRSALLDHVPVPPAHIHSITRCEQGVEHAAALYAAELQRFFDTQQPRFDLIVLGLGEDGHTASLLPASAALHEDVRWTAVARRPEEGFSRVTLTIPILNQGACTLFLVSGQSKAEMVRTILQPRTGEITVPAQLIRPREGELFWFLDQGAAGLLKDAQTA
ncbi:6-phosphogluconolactonase [Desulfobulbus oligotrophicus]|uniref:6-phosphogluconolactonase n=2 Tax=Desulfobulbus oligotrophicus TaxID=1909699 RepID=A0A7T6APA9_9BACT|nr:6-phosphogluconolactonase [Desulfobulbus oligotrophicus]